MPVTAIRGRKKSTQRTSGELQRACRFLQGLPEVSGLVMGGFEQHSHHLRRGTLRVVQQQNNGVVLKGYDESGTRRMHVYCKPVDRTRIEQKIEHYNREQVRLEREAVDPVVHRAVPPVEVPRETRRQFADSLTHRMTIPPPAAAPPLITAPEAAKILGKSKAAIYMHVARGRLKPAAPVGARKSWRFEAAAVEALKGFAQIRRGRVAKGQPVAGNLPSSTAAPVRQTLALALNALAEEVRSLRSDIQANTGEVKALRELLPAFLGMPPVPATSSQETQNGSH